MKIQVIFLSYLWLQATSRLRDSELVVSELPDPVLRGKFPEEEMQIMAHLARECLQWDPDSRPTMSEVVQILLTIAPGKSRKRNMPTSLQWVNNSRSFLSNMFLETLATYEYTIHKSQFIHSSFLMWCNCFLRTNKIQLLHHILYIIAFFILRISVFCQYIFS